MAVSAVVRQSMTIQPVLPRMKVALATSKPRTCQTPSVTLNRPCLASSCPCRQRLAFTVAGAGPFMKSKADRSHTTRPSAVVIFGSFRVARKPRLAKSKSRVSDQLGGGWSAARAG